MFAPHAFRLQKYVVFGGGLTLNCLYAWIRSAPHYDSSDLHMADLQEGAAYSIPGGSGRLPPQAPLRPRERRTEQFGPWTISKITANGTWIGYGANCGWHKNTWDQHSGRCKKALTFGIRMSPADARIRMKMWLRKGAQVEKDDCRGRHKHLYHFGYPVVYDMSDTGTEAELNAQAHALLGTSSSSTCTSGHCSMMP